MKLKQFELERFYAKFEHQIPIMFSSSDCESWSVAELLEQDLASWDTLRGLKLGYTESRGNPELREAISTLYDDISPDQILVHTGAQEAIFGFMHATLEKGDHVIVHFPCYQSLYGVAEAIGCDVTYWQSTHDQHWELDIDFLNDHIRPNTKAIVINFPHNPTGYLPDRNRFDEILALASKRGIRVFSDEVYRFLEYREQDRLPAACDVYEGAVSLGVMSKSFGLAGLRIGWVATQDPKLYRAMEAFKDFTTICAPAPSEFLSLVALRQKNRIWERNRELVSSNFSLLKEFFDSRASIFDWVPPRAGPIAFPRARENLDSEVFGKELMEKKGLLIAHGALFNSENRHFRIGFGRANFAEGLRLFDEFVLDKRGTFRGGFYK